MAIFSGSTDLLTTASLHEMCKVEDAVMQLNGYSEYCAQSPKPCAGASPSADAGLASTYFANGDTTSNRCFPPVSINRVLMANLSVTSCESWVLTIGLSAQLEQIRGALAACAETYRADGADGLPDSCTKTGFDPAYVNAGFGLSPEHSPLLTSTLVEFPMESGGVIDWLVGLETKGSLKKSVKSVRIPFPKSRHCFISQLVTICPYIAIFKTDTFHPQSQPSRGKRARSPWASPLPPPRRMSWPRLRLVVSALTPASASGPVPAAPRSTPRVGRFVCLMGRSKRRR